MDGLVHQWLTVDKLARLIPQVVRLPACPEPPRPTFPGHLADLLSSVDDFLAG